MFHMMEAKTSKGLKTIPGSFHASLSVTLFPSGLLIVSGREDCSCACPLEARTLLASPKICSA